MVTWSPGLILAMLAAAIVDPARVMVTERTRTDVVSVGHDVPDAANDDNEIEFNDPISIKMATSGPKKRLRRLNLFTKNPFPSVALPHGTLRPLHVWRTFRRSLVALRRARGVHAGRCIQPDMATARSREWTYATDSAREVKVASCL